MILPLLACLTLVGASSAPLALSSLPYGNEPLPQCVVFDETDKSITFNENEVGYTFTNLSSYLYSATFNISGSTLLYDSISYEISDSYQNGGDIYVLDYSVIRFNDPADYKWCFYNETEDSTSSLTSTLVWNVPNFTTEFFQGLKTAIEADISANSSGMSGVEVVNEIVDILAGGLTSLGSSIGAGVATFAQSLAFTDGHLSVYFVLVIAFAGVALAVGLTTLIFRWLTNLGN